MFRRRNYNIESLTVGHTDQPGVSRMTIVIDSSQTNAERVSANLYKLVNVIQIDDLTNLPSVIRDLANVKVTADGRVKVLDFGLAKAWAGHGPDASSGPPALSQSPTLARTGTVVVDFRVAGEESVYPMVPTGAALHAMIRRPARNSIPMTGE